MATVLKCSTPSQAPTTPHPQANSDINNSANNSASSNKNSNNSANKSNLKTRTTRCPNLRMLLHLPLRKKWLFACLTYQVAYRKNFKEYAAKPDVMCRSNQELNYKTYFAQKTNGAPQKTNERGYTVTNALTLAKNMWAKHAVR